MKIPELVFVPSPGIGHLASAVEIVKILVDRHDQLSITVLNMTSTSKFSEHTESLIQAARAVSSRIKFIDIPIEEPDSTLDPFKATKLVIQNTTPHIKEILHKLFFSEFSADCAQLAGFVLDMFCLETTDIAKEFGVPSYVFFTSSAASLGSIFHFQAVYDQYGVDPTEFTDPDGELEIPSFANKFPVKVLPNILREKSFFKSIVDTARKLRETKGVVINTFTELESHAINSMSKSGHPALYPVGPVLNLESDKQNRNKSKEMMEWLDDQPSKSVVFLCFGSMGSFGEDQVREIAFALEHSGHRFLWSLRRPPRKGNSESPTDYHEHDLSQVLPEGFLDRTAKVGVGKVIGWAPQVQILGHKAVGGFVSHCGWNSTLESIWHGVPMATWPMYAEQQFNAFQLVMELGLATDIKMDYRREDNIIINAKEIQNGIRCLMKDEEKRKKIKEISQISKKALLGGGSSASALDRFITHVMDIQA